MLDGGHAMSVEDKRRKKKRKRKKRTNWRNPKAKDVVRIRSGRTG
jgi:hypothetical protein